VRVTITAKMHTVARMMVRAKWPVVTRVNS
jgi:hypothetical protein